LFSQFFTILGLGKFRLFSEIQTENNGAFRPPFSFQGLLCSPEEVSINSKHRFTANTVMLTPLALSA